MTITNFDLTQANDNNKLRNAFLDSLTAFKDTCNQKHPVTYQSGAVKDHPASTIIDSLRYVHKLPVKVSKHVEAALYPSLGWNTCLEACSEALQDLLPPARTKPARFTELVALFSPSSITMQMLLAQNLAVQSCDAAKIDPAAIAINDSLNNLLAAYNALPAVDKLHAKNYGESFIWRYCGWRITHFGTGNWMQAEKDGYAADGYGNVPPWDGDCEIICNVNSFPILITEENGYSHLVCSYETDNISAGHTNIQVRDESGEIVASTCIKKPYTHTISGTDPSIPKTFEPYRNTTRSPAKADLTELPGKLKELEQAHPAALMTFPPMGKGMAIG